MEIEISHRKLSLIKGNITTQPTDAIVNAANPSLLGMGGVSGAILRVGGQALIEECRKLVQRQGRLPTGKAVMTTGGNLKAKYVIHTVGPVWQGGSKNMAELLKSSYRESLKLAERHNLASISFPSVSTGIYGYPVREAADVALKAALSFLKDEASSVKEVLFVLYDDVTFKAYEDALIGLKQQV